MVNIEKLLSFLQKIQFENGNVDVCLNIREAFNEELCHYNVTINDAQKNISSDVVFISTIRKDTQLPYNEKFDPKEDIKITLTGLIIPNTGENLLNKPIEL